MKKRHFFYLIFKVKYFPNNNIMEATNPSSASYAWRSILKGREVIKRGAIWRIEDGRPTTIWGDRWLPVKHSPKVVSPKVDSLSEARVCTLIDSNQRRWKNEVIDATMLNFEAKIIKKKFPCAIQTNLMCLLGLTTLLVCTQSSRATNSCSWNSRTISQANPIIHD